MRWREFRRQKILLRYRCLMLQRCRRNGQNPVGDRSSCLLSLLRPFLACSRPSSWSISKGLGSKRKRCKFILNFLPCILLCLYYNIKRTFLNHKERNEKNGIGK